MPKYTHSGKCSTCEIEGDSLNKCTRCGKLFHFNCCGNLPHDIEYERVDPDDMLRGMSFAGKKLRPDYSNALCGNCGEMDPEFLLMVRDRYAAVIESLPTTRELLDQAKKEMNYLDEELWSLEQDLSQLRVKLEEVQSLLERLRDEWRSLYNALKRVPASQRSAIEADLERIREHGQGVSYLEHTAAQDHSQLSQQWKSQNAKLMAAQDTLSFLQNQLDDQEHALTSIGYGVPGFKPPRVTNAT